MRDEMNREDLISRKAVLNTIHETLKTFISDEDVFTDKDNYILTVNKAVCKAINDIPSIKMGDKA